MGLTRIRTWTFWWVSQLGMLAGTVVYIYAGSTIPSLAQLADPSQLRPRDITSWTEFIARLSDHEDPSSTGRLVYQQLDEPSQNIVDTLHKTSASPNQKQQTTLLRHLNMALARPNWLPATPTPSDKNLSDTATHSHTQTDDKHQPSHPRHRHAWHRLSASTHPQPPPVIGIRPPGLVTNHREEAGIKIQ